MVIGFYDINGNYQTATQDANGNWIGSDGKPTLSMKKGQQTATAISANGKTGYKGV